MRLQKVKLTKHGNRLAGMRSASDAPASLPAIFLTLFYPLLCCAFDSDEKCENRADSVPQEQLQAMPRGTCLRVSELRRHPLFSAREWKKYTDWSGRERAR